MATKRSKSSSSTTHPYLVKPEGLYHRKPTRDDNFINDQLTNFVVDSVRQVLEDDAESSKTSYEIEARMGERTARGQVSVAEFQKMLWPQVLLGFDAVVFPKRVEHARTAIQLTAKELPARHLFKHTGWREVEGKHVFLHAGGAIGESGPVADAELRSTLSGNLGLVNLPEPPTDDELRSAVRASLKLLDAAEPSVAVPILAAIYRAPLPLVDFTMHVFGLTGSLKSAFATVAQQHYGAAFTDQTLPAYWRSTSNFLSESLFAAKDVLIVVDDFVLKGSKADKERMEKQYDETVRAVTDGAGRGRLRSNGEQAPGRVPRGLILSTGEVIPKGESGRARVINIPVSPNSVDAEKLSKLQQDAQAGVFASAMAGYIRWAAGKYSSIISGLPTRIESLRSMLLAENQHRRIPENVANLAVGIQIFLEFGVDVGAISVAEAEEIWKRAWAAFCELADNQGAHQSDEDPARETLRLLAAANRAGRLSFGNSKALTRDSLATPEIAEPERNTNGWIGWREGEETVWYCDPDPLFRIVNTLFMEQQKSLNLTKSDLWRALIDRGYIPKPNERGKATVKREVAGVRRRVIEISPDAFARAEEEDETTEARTCSPPDLVISAA